MAFSIEDQDADKVQTPESAQNSQAMPDAIQQASDDKAKPATFAGFSSNNTTSQKANADGAVSASSQNPSSAQSAQTQTLNTGGGASASVNGAVGATSGGGADTKGSGSFVDLSKYIDANKDQTPASIIADKVGAEGQAAQQSLTGAQDAFGNKVADNTHTVNNDLLAKAGTDATSVANDDNSFKEIQKERSGTYAGPHALDEESGFDSGAGQNVTNTLHQFGNEGGQQALLQHYAGRPDYSQGMQALDQYLLQNNPASNQYVQTLQNQYGNLDKAYGSAATNAQQQAQAAAATNKATSQTVNNTLGGYATTLQGGVSDQVNKYNQQGAKNFSDLQAALRSGQVNNDQASQLGLTNGQYRLYGGALNNAVDPTAYLNQAAAASQNNVGTSAQMAQDAALQKLLGQQETFFTDPTQAGKYAGPNASFDADRFKGDLGSADQNYTRTINGVGVRTDTGSTNTNDYTYGKLTDELNRLGGQQDWAHMGTADLNAQMQKAGAGTGYTGDFLKLLQLLKADQDKYGAQNVLNVASNNPTNTGAKI